MLMLLKFVTFYLLYPGFLRKNHLKFKKITISVEEQKNWQFQCFFACCNDFFSLKARGVKDPEALKRKQEQAEKYEKMAEQRAGEASMKVCFKATFEDF